VIQKLKDRSGIYRQSLKRFNTGSNAHRRQASFKIIMNNIGLFYAIGQIEELHAGR
jgi:hypothetical protein